MVVVVLFRTPFVLLKSIVTLNSQCVKLKPMSATPARLAPPPALLLRLSNMAGTTNPAGGRENRPASVIVPISHTLHTESTLRIYWFPHHTFLPPRHTNHKNNPIRRLPRIIINLLKFVVLSSLRCLVPVRFSIIVIVSTTVDKQVTITGGAIISLS